MMGQRMTAMLVAGAMAVLLLFGCLGGAKGQTGQPAGQQTVSPPAQQAGSQLGDADISGAQDEDEAVLPGEDLVPPPPEASGTATASGSSLDDSDIDLGAIEDDLVISEEDIVEPA